MATTALRPKQAQELEGPTHAAWEIPDAAGEAKGVLSQLKALSFANKKQTNTNKKTENIKPLKSRVCGTY